MREAVSTAVQSSNFNLKNEVVELIPSGVAGSAVMGVRELEAFRAAGSFVPASKHGLEVITGASCETGAQ
ncbi:hypothetical protein GT045_22400 [Streptomyces sp. SID486]|uniref:hypothetical protein n=1 Tax=unclassified Streptomyces TaxID=2593676 RepID=UPI00136C657F|nr:MULTISPECIES: hypothetical protein [unclassified Streptomyces]MYW14577.1 hypothetical protein [Streptomyces sp. SID2955]MYW45711.1 hypothetical protein [Streptomyces sp. SID161]MYX97489.1 hypothetical protein [Streptomyces sp. SID486]